MAEKVSEFQKIGQNGVNEFFEDLTYNVAYGEVLARLKKCTEMDNKVLQSALESATTVMVSSALFLYIQKQEEFLTNIMNVVWKLIAGVITFAGIGKLKKGFKGKFGRRLKNLTNFVTGERSDAINSGRMVIEGAKLMSDNMSNSNSSSLRVMPSLITKGQMIQNESHKLNIARSKVASMNETLLFKLFTKNFTSSDMDLINRITGGKSKELTADKLNQVADFMYVSDDKGNITGLSEEFMKMLNGLGYLNNKGAN